MVGEVVMQGFLLSTWNIFIEPVRGSHDVRLRLFNS